VFWAKNPSLAAQSAPRARRVKLALVSMARVKNVLLVNRGRPMMLRQILVRLVTRGTIKKSKAKRHVCLVFLVLLKMELDPRNVKIVMQECFKKTQEKRRACPVKVVRLPMRAVRFANRAILGSMEVFRENVPTVLSTSTRIHVVIPRANFVRPEKLPTKITRVVNCHRGVPAKWANI